MKIYNLFPRLAGSLDRWEPHLERASALGFDWIFVNPIQETGKSGSLYSIRDYFAIDPTLLNPSSTQSPDDQVRAMIAAAERRGLSCMVDLVINHCAYDSPLLKEHPDWFAKEGKRIAHPSCVHEGETVVWRDLARFDHGQTRDAEGLYQYCRRVVTYLLDLGFRGLRCDAAYQLPATFWKRLIADTRKSHPGIVFAAETLGCSPEQTRETARAGFDAIFNSSKWWDFTSPWLLDQYRLTRDCVPSVSFPESHDTARLFAESHHNVNALKQRYLFAALFSASVMIPMGYEFGFRRQLHVVDTRPSDWESTDIDIADFIRRVNDIKSQHPVFAEESITEMLDHPCDESVLVLHKRSAKSRQEALLILNKSPWDQQHFWCEDLYRLIRHAPPLVDVSPEWAMDYLPTPFQFDLGPGMGRVLVAG